MVADVLIDDFYWKRCKDGIYGGMYKVPPPTANLLRTLRRRNYGRYGHNPRAMAAWLLPDVEVHG